MGAGKALLQRMGMDRAIGYSLLAQGWTLVSGPLTLWFIGSHLSLVEQGFYFTFSAMLGLQVFLELGTSFVLLQFASHERAHLEWTPERVFSGDSGAKARLASLWRRSMGWYALLAGLLVVSLWPLGWLFFQNSVANPFASAALSAGAMKSVAWQGPWLWLVLATAGTLLMAPALCLVQGCGFLSEFALLRLVQNIVTSLVSWTLLAMGFHLFALPAFNTAALVLSLGWVWFRFGPMLRDLWGFRFGEIEINWKRDVWPLQWKVALTSMSGFFMHQLFTPLLFRFAGPVAAGQFGMTNTILSAVAQGGYSWINTRFPTLCGLVAKRDWRSLDALFFRSLWQATALVTVAMWVLNVSIVMLQVFGYKWGARFLPPLPLVLLSASVLVTSLAGAQSLYLRAHKQDPLFGVSLGVAALVGAGSWWGVYWGGTAGLMSVYLFASLFGTLGAGTLVFRRKRAQWHGGASSDE